MSKRNLVAIALMVADILIVAGTPYLVFFLLQHDVALHHIYHTTVSGFFSFLSFLPVALGANLAAFAAFGLYNRLWRYASIRELLAIVGGVTAGSLLTAVIAKAANLDLPLSVLFVAWLINLVLVGSSRFMVRVAHNLRQNMHRSRANVLIVGAGDAGAMIAREIQHHYASSKRVVGFLDDDPYKTGKTMFGVQVLGGLEAFAAAVAEHRVTEVIIAMPSAGGRVIKKYADASRKARCKVLTVPGVYELIDGKVSINQLRNIEFEDLLRREPVQLNIQEISACLAGKVVLVTGAGGSIGSELCRQIARMKPRRLLLLGKGENSIFEIQNELKQHHKNLPFEPIIADICDARRINTIFSRHRPQVIFHAAAHKHVPLMELQPEEAVRNNVFGTQTVAEAARRHGAEIFVLISTDKAVNPVSVMGATKRVAEMIIQNLNRGSRTRFCAVRFGNVLGSRGSVIPLFRQQIARGGPVTITHPEMRRYFMTIPEASQLVLQAGAMAQGGEVFVLDMGEPVKITDMARDLIELSGLEPGEDIRIEYTGIRPGEKLFEELLTAEEGTTATKHEKIHIANLKAIDSLELKRHLKLLKNANDGGEIIRLLMNMLPTYRQARQAHCPPQAAPAAAAAGSMEAGRKREGAIDGDGIYQPASGLP